MITDKVVGNPKEIVEFLQKGIAVKGLYIVSIRSGKGLMDITRSACFLRSKSSESNVIVGFSYSKTGAQLIAKGLIEEHLKEGKELSEFKNKFLD